MNPELGLALVAIFLILSGMAMAYFSPGVKSDVLTKVLFWVGVFLIIVGLVVLLAPAAMWCRVQFRAMLGL